MTDLSALEAEIIAMFQLLDADAKRRVIARIRSELEAPDTQMSAADMIHEVREERDNQIMEAIWGPQPDP